MKNVILVACILSLSSFTKADTATQLFKDLTELEQAVDSQIQYETLSMAAKTTDACKKAYPYKGPRKIDLNQADVKKCNADKDCVFCIAGAVPSECKSVEDGKKLNGGAFKCKK